MELEEELEAGQVVVEENFSSEEGLLSRRCPLCGYFEYPTVPMLLSHLRTVHSNDPRFHVTCGVGGCTVSSRSFSALYSHIYRHHPDVGIVKKREFALSSQAQQPCVNVSATVSQNADDQSDLDGHTGK